MLWTRFALRCQLRHVNTGSLYKTESIQASKSSWISSLELRKQYTLDEQDLGNDSGVLNEADQDLQVFLKQPSSPTKKKIRRPRHRTVPQYQGSLDEHVKSNLPPIRFFNVKGLVMRREETRSLWTNREYRGHVRNNIGPLKIIARTNSPSMIWEAYRNAVKQEIHIPTLLLHRVARILTRAHAPTRQTFLRLHEVYHHIRQQGGYVGVSQWNTLIYHSALALRRVHTKDYHAALDVYRDMLSSQNIKGTSGKAAPDIFTYTILLYIAIRTGHHENVHHAYHLLHSSNLPQDRIARLSIIPWYIHQRNLKGVRKIAETFAARQQDIGIDGINAYLWAFGKHGHLDVVEEVYQALRRNVTRTSPLSDETGDAVVPTPAEYLESASSSTSASHAATERDAILGGSIDDTLDVLNWPLSLIRSRPPHHSGDEEPQEQIGTLVHGSFQQVNRNLVIWNHHVPDSITYCISIQVYAYHHNYRRALEIFRDMLITTNAERPWESNSTPYKALHKVYRALFLGFSRHTRTWNIRDEETGLIVSTVDDAERAWVGEALDVAFTGFLNMDPDQGAPNHRTVLWILRAYANIFYHDANKLCEVWQLMANRFDSLHIPHTFQYVAKASHRAEADRVN